MRVKVCQGVSGFLAVTMVTSLMLVYKGMIHSDRASMASPASARSSPPQPRTSVKKRDTPAEKPTVSTTLHGYTAVLDQRPLKMHCKTCAVVSSSGHLTHSNRGEEIDQSECVIRMNNAPCVGYQRDVGKRTTVRVIAHSSLQEVLKDRRLLNSSQDTVFIFWGPSHAMRRDGRGHVFNSLRELKHTMPKLQIYILSRFQMLKIDELFKKETGTDRRKADWWLSTGFFSMATALEMCDRISVFGMVPPDYCRSSSRRPVPYHYYQPSGLEECSMYLSHEKKRRSSHHFITEKMVFSNWARTLSIDFHQPDWGPSAVGNRSSSVS